MDISPARAVARLLRVNPSVLIRFTPEVKPGDPEYAALALLWQRQGRAETFEHLSEGWLRRAVWHDPSSSEPTFVLVAGALATNAALEGPIRGYANSMGTRQSSLPGSTRELPRE